MTDATSGNVLVLVVDLVVEERHDQTAGGTGGSALLPLVAADGVVGVQGTLALIVDTSEDGCDVVGEEALAVQNVAETLGACGDAHGLVVLVSVHLDDGVETLGQGVAVGGKAYHAENNLAPLVLGTLATDAEELWLIAGVNVVARCGTGVAGEDGEVCACDAQSATAVVCVSVMTLSDARLNERRRRDAGRLTDRNRRAVLHPSRWSGVVVRRSSPVRQRWRRG